MSRLCTLCSHPLRDAIDETLVKGSSVRQVAETFGVSSQAVQRHRTSHLPETLVRAHEAEEAARAADLLGQLRDLQKQTLRTLADAERAGELRTVLAAVREARGNLQLLGRMAAEIDQQSEIDLDDHPQWARIRDTIFEVLRPHPEIRYVLAERLAALDAGPPLETSQALPPGGSHS